MKIDYQKRIFGLDVMRAAAIMFVVCSHALWVFPSAEGGFASLLRLSGVMGVEIFFVLSGFLIGRILFRIFTNEEFTTSHLIYFLIRRWFRTLPNYYLVLLLNIALVIYLGRDLPDTLPLYFGFLQNFNFGMNIFFTESWSLPIEEFAYVIGPLLFYLALLRNWNIPRRKLFFMVTLVIILFFIITKVLYNQQTGPNSLDYWNINLKAVVLYRIDAIYYGVMAAYFSLVFEERWKKYTVFCFFFGIVLFLAIHGCIAWLEMDTYRHPFFFNVVYLPLCSLCIAGSLPFFSRLKRATPLFLRPITFISLISYSMYLLHYSIILQILNYYVDIEAFTTFDKWAFSIGYLTMTILFAYILYRIFEKPMMDIRDRGYFRRKFHVE